MSPDNGRSFETPLQEHWFTLEVNQAVSIGLALDVSASARPHWQYISQFAGQLIAAIPRGTCKIFFLGGAKSYDAEQFMTHQAEWYRNNVRRARFIGPIMPHLERSDIKTLLVLTSGRIHDLEDWRETALLESIRFVRFGKDAVTAPLAPEWEPDLENLQRECHDTLEKVELKAEGFFPFFWNNEAYQWSEAALCAVNAKQYSVCVGLLGRPEGIVEANGVFVRAGVRPLVVRRCSPCQPPPHWHSFSQKETQLFRQILKEGHYRCPLCGEDHSAERLQCKTGAKNLILGDPIYSSLSSCRAQGFLIFHDFDTEVRWYPHSCAAIRVGCDQVAFRKGGRATIYRFDPVRNRWLDSGERLRPYSLIEEERYAIIL